jgi:hypothetical protein
MIHARRLLVLTLLSAILALTGCAEMAGAVVEGFVDGMLGTEYKPHNDTQQPPTITSIKTRSAAGN